MVAITRLSLTTILLAYKEPQPYSFTVKRQILFLCVANSARSQMAEALARVVLGVGSYHFESAGSEPAGGIHPLAVQVMREKDIDITAQRSKAWTELPET